MPEPARMRKCRHFFGADPGIYTVAAAPNCFVLGGKGPKMTVHENVPTNINDIIRAHIKQYLTEPEKAHLWDATPVGMPKIVTTLLLTTIGRKSGEARHVPLLYVADGDDYLVMGSKGGYETDPLWFKNLQANPDCEIRVSTLHTKAHANILSSEERAKVWPKITALHENYAKYQEIAPREIPVVRLVALVA